MNPEVKQLWLNALRSGEYKQGSGALRSIKDEWCCLAVLIDIYIKENLVSVWSKNTDDAYYNYNGNTTYLTDAVAEWSGVGSVDPVVHDANGNVQSLALLNDSGMSFAEIADLIESQF